ncbi:MAG: hypothetical protein ACR2O1_02845 [Boseongicola sp.]
MGEPGQGGLLGCYRRIASLVTHREATVAKCTNVVRIYDGRLTSQPAKQIQTSEV